MTQHTPTPWEDIEGEPYHGIEIIDGNGHCFMATKEDRAFIVRACNSHDALVEALEWVINRQDVTEAIKNYCHLALAKGE